MVVVGGEQLMGQLRRSSHRAPRRAFPVLARVGALTCVIGALFGGMSVPASAADATFGKTTVGATTTFASGDYKFVSKFTLPVDGDVSKLTVSVKGSGTAGAQPMRGILYADSGGVPGALKGTTGEVTVAFNAAKGWVDLVFPAPLRLAQGDYWLGIHSAPPPTGDALMYFSYDALVAGQRMQN